MDTKIKASEDLLKLQAFIEKQEHGAELSYSKIEYDTGVVMDTHGKQILRRAIKRAKREYSSQKSYGVKLACQDTAMPILSNKIIKIDRAVKRAEKTHHTLESQFFEQLSPEKQKQILYIGAIFGAIRIAAENGKKIYLDRDKGKPAEEIRISIPFLP